MIRIKSGEAYKSNLKKQGLELELQTIQDLANRDSNAVICVNCLQVDCECESQELYPIQVAIVILKLRWFNSI
jgi:hypothetical protein